MIPDFAKRRGLIKFAVMLSKVSRVASILALSFLGFTSITYSQTFHCQNDSLKAVSVLSDSRLAGMAKGERNVAIAEMLAGIPAASKVEAAASANGNVAIRLCEVDPLQFVNTVLAFNNTVSRDDSDIMMLSKEYADVARRKGKETEDWMAHFLFPADWLNDNLFRRNLQEVSGNFNQILHEKFKTIDYVTHNRDDYAVLKDSALYDRVRRMEMGYVQYPLRFLPINSFTKRPVKEGLADGDILVIYSTENDLDSRDIGFVTKDNGECYLLHVSPGEGKVCREELPLDKYFKRNVKRIMGVRVFRLPESN